MPQKIPESLKQQRRAVRRDKIDARNRLIVQEYVAGEDLKIIAKKYDLRPGTVSSIVGRHSTKYPPDEGITVVTEAILT